jgi:sulfite exporter TauE/SafE
MLAFGLGTLPAMLGLTLAAPAVSVLFRDRVFRRLVGFFLLLLAAWMIYSLGMHAGSAHQHHEARHSTHEGGP